MQLSASEQIASASPSSIPSPPESDNRRIQRISLPLPVRVEVRVSTDVTWSEITRLIDISAFGAGFSLNRPVKRGRMALLTIPMPRQLRSFDFSEPQYKVWANIRRCISVGKSVDKPEYMVGVAFTGKAAPEGYLEHPAKLYDVARRDGEGTGFWHLYPADLMADESDLPNELRKQTRFFIPEPIVLELLDENGSVVRTESTVSENISYGGASVFTSFVIPNGSFVRVISHRFDVTVLTIVRGQRVGSDGVTRLHLEFIDRYFPLEGIVSG